MKAAIAAIILIVLALGGAVGLMVWFSGMAPIHVSESADLVDEPPTATDIARFGAGIAVVGRVEAVYAPEWNTDDFSRPGTPWDVSRVPDEIWIQTPVRVELDEHLIPLSSDAREHVNEDTDSLLVTVRGGEIDSDLYEIDDGQDRTFEIGERVFLVLGSVGEGSDDIVTTSHGDAWQLVRKYQIRSDGTAVLVWDDEVYERSLDDLIAEYQQVLDQ